MTSFYTTLAQVASDLISAKGKSSAYIRSKSGATSDPVAGTITGGTSTDTLVYAVQTKYNEQYQPGAMIQAGDKMFSLTSAPGLDDFLIIDGEQWKVVQVWPVQPGDTLVCAFAQVRK